MTAGRLTRRETAAVLKAARLLKTRGRPPADILNKALKDPSRGSTRRRGRPRLSADQKRQADLDLTTLDWLSQSLETLDDEVSRERTADSEIENAVRELPPHSRTPLPPAVIAKLLAAHRKREHGGPSLRDRAAMWLEETDSPEQARAAIDRWKKAIRPRPPGPVRHTSGK